MWKGEHSHQTEHQRLNHYQLTYCQKAGRHRRQSIIGPVSFTESGQIPRLIGQRGLHSRQEWRTSRRIHN